MSTINSTNSASGSSSGSNTVYKTNSRVTGMFSSLDTDALVKSMTSGQQTKIDAVRRKQTRQEWYNDALKNVKAEINEFLNTYVSASGEFSMLKSTSYAKYETVTSSTANAASVTASSSAEAGDISIQINKLASNASVSSSTKISKNGTEISSSNTAKLSSLSLANNLEFGTGGKISFAINGKTFSFTKDTTLQSMINTINTDTTANVTMKYSRLSDTFTITSDSGGVDSSVKITNLQGNAFGTKSAFGIADVSVSATGTSVSSMRISDGGTGLAPDNTATLAALNFSKDLTFNSSNNISFSINGKTFTFANTTTLQDMLDTVNNDTTANVTMLYNRSADGFTIMSDAAGDGSVKIKNISGNAFGAGSAFGISEMSTNRGTDSEAVIDGITVTRDSNEYTIDGISYDLKKVTKGTSEETVDFTLDRDYSSTISTVSKFVDAYNKIFLKLNELVGETDYSAEYPPLTDTQKEAMSEDQIAAWETKAKSGLLSQNKDLVNLISGLKNAFYSSLGGTGKNATEIGITTAGYFDANAGQISLSEDKLSEALKNNPEDVIRMFTNGGSNTASSLQGLAYKIRNSITNYTSTVTNAMKSAAKQISSYDTEISGLEDKLGQLADRFYSKFSSMETALSKLNSQSSYISQLFK